MNLSNIYEFQQKIISYQKQNKQNLLNLIKIRQDLYNDWLEEYETTALNKYKNTKLRIKIKVILLSFSLLLPPFVQKHLIKDY